MTEPLVKPSNGNGMRWVALGVIVLVIAAFISAYTFINNNFVSRREYEAQAVQASLFVTRREFDEVRSEQARRTPIVFGSIAAIDRELVEIRRRLEQIELLLRVERRR